MPFQVPGAGENVSVLQKEEMDQGIALTVLYSPRNATLTGRHQPSCSQIATASESNLQNSAVLKLGRPILFRSTVKTGTMGSIHVSFIDIKYLS